MSLPALPQLARIPSPLSALIVGAICGALVVGLVFSGERGCDAVAGSPSCGGGVGLLMLTAILVGAYAVGVLLLRIFSVDEAGLTAFFGIMLPLVVVLAFLTDRVFSTSMVLILPVLSACSFAVGSVFTIALENSDDSGRVRPQVPQQSAPADAADQQPEPPDLPRYAPVGDDDATQPLVVSGRSAEDETTMLSAAEERQATQPDAASPETAQQSRPQTAETSEPPSPEQHPPDTDTEAADRDNDIGDEERPSPWRRA